MRVHYSGVKFVLLLSLMIGSKQIQRFFLLRQYGHTWSYLKYVGCTLDESYKSNNFDISHGASIVDACVLWRVEFLVSRVRRLNRRFSF